MPKRREWLFIAPNANNQHRRFIALTCDALAISRRQACASAFYSTPANSFVKTPVALAPFFVSGCPLCQ